MSEQPTPRVTGVYHLGMHARDPQALAEFYRDVMGMQIVGGSGADDPFGASAFLSSRPADESHEIAIFANPIYKHTAFKVASLADLRAFYRRIVDRGLPIRMALNHGVSLAFYFADPEGNLIEVYWPTGVRYGQPYGHPIDLTLPEADLLQDVADLAERVGVPGPAAARPAT